MAQFTPTTTIGKNSALAATPFMYQQYLDFQKFMSMNCGSDPVQKAPQSVRPEISVSEFTEKPKRKYNRAQPDTPAKSHEVGHREMDSKGRIHEVVVVPAFGSVRKAWKIIPNLDRDSRPTSVESKHVTFGPLVDYSDSEDESHEPVAFQEMKYQSDSDGEQKTKRKYTSSKPKIDPRQHGEGAVVESEGKMWVVAEVKTRGDGRRLLWKILKPDVGSHTALVYPPAYPPEMDSSVAANLLMGLSSEKVMVEEQMKEVEKMEVEKPKKARPGPEESAAQFDVGVELVGKDGQTKFKCVERTRKGKDGAEPKTYKVWQKMKAE